MIAAINVFFRFCGWHDLCVKQYKIQKSAFASEEKELTKVEYGRLVQAAKRKKNERLNLIIQTICGTGIRVSELMHITVEAVKRGEAFVNCKGKNRRVFIVSDLRKKLLRYIDEQNIVSGAVFITRGGKPVSRHNIWRDMKSLCKDVVFLHFLPPEKNFLCLLFQKSLNSLYPRSILSKFLFYFFIKSPQKYFS